MIITLSGASGTGKTTVADRLMKRLPDARALVSMTTRDPRPTDLPGDFQYITHEAFDDMDRRGVFLWTATVGTTRHGTATDDLRNAFGCAQTAWIMILVPEVLPLLHGFAAREGFADHLRSFFILNPANDVLRRRMAERGDAPDRIEERMAACAAYQTRAQTSDIPYIYIPDHDDLDAKTDAVLRGISA